MSDDDGVIYCYFPEDPTPPITYTDLSCQIGADFHAFYVQDDYTVEFRGKDYRLYRIEMVAALRLFEKFPSSTLSTRESSILNAFRYNTRARTMAASIAMFRTRLGKNIGSIIARVVWESRGCVEMWKPKTNKKMRK
jgi:hypothetical protein